MKSRTIVMALLAVFTLSIFAFAHGNHDADEIAKLIEKHYVGAQKTRNPELLETFFHDDWTMKSIDKEGKLVITDKKTFLSYFDPKKADPNRKVEVEFISIKVYGNSATALLKLILPNVTFYDSFQLMKFGKDWKVVSKIYHAVRK